MKALWMLFRSGLILLMVLMATRGFSQTKYVLSSTPSLKIEGGSTLHDWQMETKSAIGEGLFLVEGGLFKGAESLNLRFQAESLVSGTKGLDVNAYKALNTQKHKEITFKLKELTGSGTNFTAFGDLTVAGVTTAICFPVNLRSAEGKFTFEGKLSTKLTTFLITPPTVLLGTIKTKDEITLSFKTTFQPIL